MATLKELQALCESLNRRVTELEYLTEPDENKVQRAIAALERLRKLRFRWIRFYFGEDHSGTPSVFFRVVLADAACLPDALLEQTRAVTDALRKELDRHRFATQSYFNFRSESEQNRLKEPAWERPWAPGLSRRPVAPEPATC
jgi:hypothetical protein